MRHSSKTWLGAIMLIGVFTVAASAGADNIIHPGEQFFGKSYNELASEWTNWLVKEPIATNPAFDPDGSFCGSNQHGRVWFLASTFDGVVNRTCEIPAGRAIFFSLGGVFVSFSPEFPADGDPCRDRLFTTLEQVRCDVNDDVPLAPGTSFKVEIDGIPVKDLFAFRAQSEPKGFTLHVPESSLLTDFGFEPGDRYPAVADGYFLFLRPLKPGVHTIKILMTNPDQSQAGVNYTLRVPRHRHDR